MRASREEGWSSRRSCSEGVEQHERQDVMVYSAQEWGRRGQGAPCPQRHPPRDLLQSWQTPLSAGKSLNVLGWCVYECARLHERKPEHMHSTRLSVCTFRCAHKLFMSC